MKTVMTAAAVLAASILLAACGKKEEAVEVEAAPVAAEPAPAMEVTPAPTDEAALPAENSEDAEQSGGDKVKPGN